MFRHVFFHELRLFRQNPSWWGSLLVLVLLTVAAAWNGQLRVAARSAELADAAAAAEQMKTTLAVQLRKYEATQDADRPPAANAGAMGFSILQTPASIPARPLQPLALGQSDTLQDTYPVTAHAAYSFMNAAEIRNPNNLLAGSFDVAFVIVFVLPVFIIALTFDLLSREKERGLLALALAHGVALPAYTLAKCMARAAIVIGVTLAVSVASFLVVGADIAAPGALQDLLGWCIVVVLYASLWFAIGLYVNAFSLKSETNGVLLANIWLTAVVVLPALVNVLATSAYPAPSRVTLTTELREAATEAEQQAAEAREAYFFDHPELSDEQAPGAFFREVLASEMAIEMRIDPLLEDFERQSRERAGVVNTLQFLSPAIVTQQALTTIAGTDEARYERFRQQLREFHDVYRGFFADRMLADQLISSADIAQIPVFSFVETRSRWPASAITALLLITVLLGALSLRRYRSYPILQAT